MKKYLIIAILNTIFINLNAQTPKFINYQGLARDASGNPITNQSVALGFTITNGATTPYTDSKNATTNGFGLFNTTIGSASNPINSDLALGNFSLITSVNGNILTPQILASVPYALNAPEPAVSYSTGVLTIGSVTVPYTPGTNYQAGDGISINSGSIINTAKNQTINITSSGIATVSSAYPNFNVGVPTPTLTYNNISNILTLNNGATTSTTSISSSTASAISITGSGNAVVSPTTGSSFNVNVPTQTLSVSGGSVVSSNLGGSFSFPPTPSLALIGSTLTSGVSSNSVDLSTLTSSGWGTTGNSGTNQTSNFIGTTDNNGLTISTNSLSRIGINGNAPSGSGGVVIGGSPTSTSLGKDLTLQGPLLSLSDKIYGQFAIRGSGLGNLPQTFMTFNGQLGTVNGFLGDTSILNNDIELRGINNLKLGAGSPTINPPVLFINGSNNKIAVGNFTLPVAKLDVQTNDNNAAINGINNGSTTSTFAYGVYGETKTSSAQGAAIYGENKSIGAGVRGVNLTGTNTGNEHGVFGETNSSAINSYGIYGKNIGAGSGVFGRATNSIAINAYGVYGSNIGLGAGVHGINTSSISSNNGHGVLGITQNTDLSAAGVFGVNDSNGPSIYGVKQGGAAGYAAFIENKNNTNSSAALHVVSNSSSGYAGSFFNSSSGGTSLYASKNSTGSVAYFENFSSSNSSSALFVSTNGNGAAGFFQNINSSNSSPALNVNSNSNAAFALSVLNTGNQASFYTHKTGSATGNAAYIENLTPTNPAQVLQVVNNSNVPTSPAINAASNSSIAAIGVQLENTHIKSVGSLSFSPTYVVPGISFSSSGNIHTYINCTDVKGKIILSNTTFTTIPVGDYLEITIPFNKPYSSTPIVVVSQVYTTDNASKFTFFVKNVLTSNFTIRIMNTDSSLPLTLVGTDTFSFNYFIIE
ncbi:MAG: hypothetical protein LCH32_12275 [Bacteroidetes bacterium]|nr:hypothetical protein [Bacteroidota bacterium]